MIEPSDHHGSIHEVHHRAGAEGRHELALAKLPSALSGARGFPAAVLLEETWLAGSSRIPDPLALELRAGPHRLRRRAMAAVGLILAVALSGCGEGGRNRSGGGEADAGSDGGDPRAFRLERLNSGQGVGVMKLLPLKEGVLALIERPLDGYWVGERALMAFNLSGAVRFEYAGRPDRNVLDFAVHASGEVTVVMASRERFFLARLATDGRELVRQELQDSQVTLDPHWPVGSEPEPAAEGLRPSSPSDSLPPEARLVSLGDSVVIALRTQTHSLLAYRYEWKTGEGFSRTWRKLLVPSWTGPGPLLLVPDTATHDTFGQMLLGHALHLDADAEGRVYVATAVAQDRSAIQKTTWTQVPAHFWLLGDESPERTQQLDGVRPQMLTSATLLIVLSERGEHRYTRALNFGRAHELYGMRRLDDKLYFLGRTFAGTQGRTEFDAFVAAADADSGEARFSRVIDLQQGDIFYDIAQAGKMLLAVGATNWTQNLEGFSVSSDSEKLAAILRPDTGALHCRLRLPAGPRHNELRSAVADSEHPGSLYMGGAENGPSSHTPVDEIFSDLYLVRATGEPPCEGAVASEKEASK